MVDGLRTTHCVQSDDNVARRGCCHSTARLGECIFCTPVFSVPLYAGNSAAPASIAEMARQCAEHRNPSPLSKEQILARVRASETRLEAVHQSLGEAARLDHTLTASAEWLLDNGYLIRTGIAEIRRSL